MKKNLGPVNLLYPMPTTIVGTLVDGKPNFATVAHVGILNSASPHLISISLGKLHHTTLGIQQNSEFSVNLPSVDMLEEVDLAGMVSGRHTDKAVRFDHFFGDLKAAPMVIGCPVNMECKVRDAMEIGTHILFAAEIACSHCDDAALTPDGKGVDLASARPLLFDMNSRRYWSVGVPQGTCWGSGKELMRNRKKS